jgi:glycosyltransferase involved in cell wall biosynthesis
VYLLVANGFPPTAYGGVEVYVSDLSRALAGEGTSLAVVCAEHRGDVDDGKVLVDRVGDVPVYRIVNDFKSGAGFQGTYLDHRIEGRFHGLLATLQPDVVHFNHLIALSVGLPEIVRGAGVPSVFTLHDFWPLCQRVNLLDWRRQRCPGPRQGGDCHRCLARGTLPQRLRTAAISAARSIVPFRVRSALRDVLARGGGAVPDLYPSPELLEERYHLFRQAVLMAYRVLAPSQFVKDTYVRNGYPEDRIEVLPLGLDPPSATYQPPSRQRGDLRFGYVGSLLPIKGVDVLVKAFRSVRGHGISLDLYGRTDIVPPYTRYLRLLSLVDRRVRLRGPFRPEDKDAIYSQIDVLVVPSLAHETFSFVAREALLRGKPVVASAVGALAEAIVPGVNGWHVTPGSVTELSRVLSDVVHRPLALAELRCVEPKGSITVRDHVARMQTIYTTATGRV